MAGFFGLNYFEDEQGGANLTPNQIPQGTTDANGVYQALDTQKMTADSNVAGSGYNLGSLQGQDQMYDETSNRPDQTVKERTVEQMGNFAYGGSPTGAQDAIAAAQGNINPYTSGLSGMGQGFYGTSQAADAERQQGVGGLYGAAGSLMGYAQQGPGASVAQAQLNANTAQAMRQQLAMAGSGRGAGGGAAAFRQAAANQAQIAGQGNAQSAMLQAQEAQNWRQAQLAAMQEAGSLYGQGAGLGGQYSMGMGQLGVDATGAAGSLQAGTDALAHQINMGQLQGSMGYEGNLTSIYGINKGVAVQNQLADKAAAQAREAAAINAVSLGTAGLLSDDEK